MSPPDLLASAINMELLLASIVPVRSAKYWRAFSRGTLKLTFAIRRLISLVNGPYSLSAEISIALTRVIPLLPASAISLIRCGILLSMASRRLESWKYIMAGGMRASIPAKSAKRSRVNLPVAPRKFSLTSGPLSPISNSPQKKTPAKITPLMTQINFRASLLTALPKSPPPSAFSFLPFLASAPMLVPAGAEGGGVLIGCDIFLALTFRLHRIQDEEEHYSADGYEDECEEVHEGEDVDSTQASSDGRH